LPYPGGATLRHCLHDSRFSNWGWSDEQLQEHSIRVEQGALRIELNQRSVLEPTPSRADCRRDFGIFRAAKPDPVLEKGNAPGWAPIKVLARASARRDANREPLTALNPSRSQQPTLSYELRVHQRYPRVSFVAAERRSRRSRQQLLHPRCGR